MHRSQTIATCCYCGNHAALVLSGQVLHELACSSCGAPMRRLKNLRAHEHTAQTHPAHLSGKIHKSEERRRKKSKKQKKRRKTVSRLFDVAEDIFDIFD